MLVWVEHIQALVAATVEPGGWVQVDVLAAVLAVLADILALEALVVGDLIFRAQALLEAAVAAALVEAVEAVVSLFHPAEHMAVVVEV